MKKTEYYRIFTPILKYDLPPSAILAHAVIATHSLKFKAPYARGYSHLAKEIGHGVFAVRAAIDRLREKKLIRIEAGQGKTEANALYAEPINQTRYLRAYKEVSELRSLNGQSLNGNDKLVYFLIANYTDDPKQGALHGGLDAICIELRINQKTARSCLRKLIAVDLVEKTETAYRTLFPESITNPNHPDSENKQLNDGKNQQANEEKTSKPDGKNQQAPLLDVESCSNIYGNTIGFPNEADERINPVFVEGQTGATAPPGGFAAVPKGTPFEPGEVSDPMPAPSAPISTQGDAPPQNADDEPATTPDHASAPVPEERPPIIPDGKTRQGKWIDLYEKILAYDFHGFTPSCKEVSDWMVNRTISGRRNTPDFAQYFRNEFARLQSARPENQSIEDFRASERARRANNRNELETKLQNLKERYTA